MVTRFRALSVPLGTSTGDRRRLAPGVVDAAPTPMPLRWTREDNGAHMGAVTIGSIDRLQSEGNDIWVEGRLFDDVDPQALPRLYQDVCEAKKLMSEGVVGLSIDPDDYEVKVVIEGSDDEVTESDIQDPETKVEELVTKARIRAATLVPIPAFIETNHTISLAEDDTAVSEPDNPAVEEPEMALTAAVSGDVSLPVTDERDHEWDGNGARRRVLEFYTKDGKLDAKAAGKAFLWVDTDAGEGENLPQSAFKLGFADIVDGKLQIVPRGVAATAGGRGVDSTEGVDKAAVKKKICALYGTVRKKFDDWPECPYEQGEACIDCQKDKATSAEEYQALVASASAPVYDIAAFSCPVEIKGPTPITYDFDKGVVYGHVAPWGVCHEGFKDTCLLAPRDPSGSYREFHVHRVPTTAGVVYAGRITAGGDHPSSLDDTLTAHKVRRAHDEKTTVAYVQATEDEYGIFICGPMVSTTFAPDVMRTLARRKISADWRETADGMSMIEVLALPPGARAQSEPGFPVRAAYSGGRQVALTASLSPEPLPSDHPAARAKMIDLGEAFKQAYYTIKDEEKRAAEAWRAREELSIVMSADASRLRDDLAATIAQGGADRGL